MKRVVIHIWKLRTYREYLQFKMARRKRKTKSSLFSFSSGKKKTKTQRKQRSEAIRSTLMIFTVLVVLAVIGIGLIFLERYNKPYSKMGEKIDKLELIDEPFWVSEELRAKIVNAATSMQDDLILDENTARIVAENLATVVWLDDVKVRVTNKAIQIGARYRKPLALIKTSGRNYYIDDEFVLLDYVPINKLAIVEIKGGRYGQKTRPAAGSSYQSDDIAAAITLLELLNKMDAEVSPEKPLLYEIDSIDVSNYNGRKSSRQPHIVLYAKDGTEIQWGAEKGKWHLHLEARDEEKLALLYNTYEVLGTLQLRSNHTGNFVDLRTPQKTLLLPIDRY